jgi:Rps23 Pro-64 3,4-dihydroxylase Tpa1-like proline 4-hydroxylase
VPLLPPFHVFRDFLPDAERAALLDFALASEESFVPTTIVRNAEAVVDVDSRISTKLPDLGPFTGRLRRALRDSSGDIFARTGVRPFDVGRIEVELVAHNDGAHFARHSDTLAGANRQRGPDGAPADRVVSGVYYFYREPKGFAGGELRLHAFDFDGAAGDFVDIEPAQNSLLVFPSFAAHEVRRVSCPGRRFEDSRFAVNCWFHRGA